jgi:hypothetical protein
MNQCYLSTQILLFGFAATQLPVIFVTEKSLFSGDLVPSIYKVSTANGTDSPTLMGTVILQLRDNEGVVHNFTLTHVNYMPKSPVNLLSL